MDERPCKMVAVMVAALAGCFKAPAVGHCRPAPRLSRRLRGVARGAIAHEP